MALAGLGVDRADPVAGRKRRSGVVLVDGTDGSTLERAPRSVVVLGGGLTRCGDAFLKEVRERAREKYWWSLTPFEPGRIVLSASPHAGALGAAAIPVVTRSVCGIPRGGRAALG